MNTLQRQRRGNYNVQAGIERATVFNSRLVDDFVPFKREADVIMGNCITTGLSTDLPDFFQKHKLTN